MDVPLKSPTNLARSEHPQPLDSPLSWPLHELAIELTVRCNLSCEMCSVWQGQRDGVDQALARDVLASGRRLGATSFVPTGAESFMRRDFLSLLEYAHELGYQRQEVVTNGTLLFKHLDRLAGVPTVRLHVSIDGPEPIHDRLRGKGVYERAVAGVRGAVERGISVGLSGVLMRPTLDTAEHIIDLAVSLGLQEVSFQPFQPEIAGSQRLHDEWTFSAEDRLFVADRLQAIREYARAAGVNIYSESIFGEIIPYLFDGVRPIPPGGCFMPSRFLLIDVNGEAFPCFFMRETAIGNVLKGDRLEDLWHNPVQLRLQVVALSSKCPGCLAACSDIASYEMDQARLGARG